MITYLVEILNNNYLRIKINSKCLSYFHHANFLQTFFIKDHKMLEKDIEKNILIHTKPLLPIHKNPLQFLKNFLQFKNNLQRIR